MLSMLKANFSNVAICEKKVWTHFTPKIGPFNDFLIGNVFICQVNAKNVIIDSWTYKNHGSNIPTRFHFLLAWIWHLKTNRAVVINKISEIKS